MVKKIIWHCKYIQGYLRNGHIELILNDEEYKEFKSLSLEEQTEWIREGNFIIDSYRIEDFLLNDDYIVENYEVQK